MCEPFTYRVDGICCEHCKVAVSGQVARVAGVAAVDVDLDTKLVRVSGHEIDHADVVTAIGEAGYGAELAS